MASLTPWQGQPSDTVVNVATTTTPRRQGARHTTVALKMIMAVSGLLLVGFLLVHMYGNTKAFISKEAFDTYAEHLRELGEPILPHEGGLWIFRFVLLAAILGHIYSAVALWQRGAKARGGGYKVRAKGTSPYLTHIMRWGGVTLALFIVFHILQFTTSTIKVDGTYYESPYERMVAGFQPPWVVAFYVLALAFLCMHIWHGVWSALQTLGTVSDKSRATVKTVASVIAVVLFIGFASVPVAAMTGILT